MKIIYKVIVSLIFLNGPLLAATHQTKLVQFPQVLSYSGNIFIESGLENKFRKAKLKEILREKAVIKTEANSRMDVAIDKDRTVTILESTEIEIPTIAWESGQFTELVLKSGQIMWQQSAAPDNNITLKSPVFEVKPPIGISGFSYDDEHAIAEAKVFAGAMEFSALNAETSVILTAGKSVQFKGVKEDGEVAYDILLKGRKIPKGVLQKVENLPDSVMQIYSPQ